MEQKGTTCKEWPRPRTGCWNSRDVFPGYEQGSRVGIWKEREVKIVTQIPARLWGSLNPSKTHIVNINKEPLKVFDFGYNMINMAFKEDCATSYR